MIDGWIVRAVWAGISAYWVVKGYEHPEWGVVAVPYRVMGERYPAAWYPHVFPGVDAWLDCMGRRVPVLPLNRIVNVIDPGVALRLRWLDLPAAARELAEHVEAEGLTGSWAVAVEGRGSDVDLISFNREAYRALRDLAVEGLLTPCPRRPKWGPRAPRRRSLLDACYKGVPFTLRILRVRYRKPCTAKRWLLGRYKGGAVLRDIGESHLIPARYELVAPGIGSLTLETWHTRFQELPEGAYNVDVAVYYSEGEGLIASPDIDGGMEPARRNNLH